MKQTSFDFIEDGKNTIVVEITESHGFLRISVTNEVLIKYRYRMNYSDRYSEGSTKIYSHSPLSAARDVEVITRRGWTAVSDLTPGDIICGYL